MFVKKKKKVIKYQENGHFSCHVDYFWDGDGESTSSINFKDGVNRFATFLLYLRSPEKGEMDILIIIFFLFIIFK